MQISLGPVQFYWTRERLFDFYTDAADWPVDIVYLGETVCSRRRDMKLDDWLGVARELQQSGKQVVLSTLTLIESEADLRGLRKLCDNAEFMVEANDHSALQRLVSVGLPFVAGPALNLYNLASLQLLKERGLERWCMPVEMSREALGELLQTIHANGIEAPCEVFAYGHLPLAWSARCFTARHHDLPKDRCQFVCQKYPEGMPLRSQDASREVFILNGIQTLSGACYDLRHEIADMQRLGVSVARLSPRAEGMQAVVEAFNQARHGTLPARDPLALVEAAACDGYWHGRPGMAHSQVVTDQAL